MKKPRIKWTYFSCLTVFLLIANSAYAVVWQVESSANRTLDAYSGSQFSSDDGELRNMLSRVPDELSGQTATIHLPMPDGSLARYEIAESSIMQPGLAAKFPEIKSYVVRGIDHPGASGRVDISPKGFRGMIFTPYGRVFIDPLQSGSTQYQSRTSQGHVDGNSGLQCSVYDLDSNQSSLRSFNQESFTSQRISGSILGYRLAVSATPEYVVAVGGSLNDAIAEINTVINRVNQIYERDLGIKFFLVSGNDELIDVDGEAGFTNNFGPLLLSENQEWIDSIIGQDSYDIGHIFSTGGGGVARLRSVCSVIKAQGVTGLPNPADLMSDVFYIDFVSHEIGHQFGGNHSYNGSEGFCGGQRNGDTAFEPGSGSTIMSYAGICASEDLQVNADATFHAGTIAEINSFVTDPDTGGSCATILDTLPVNNDPALSNAGGDRIIPANTPFSLVGSATDADGDVLSYQWDQLDAGGVTGITNASTFGTDQGDNPLFRSYEPQNSSERHFPSLQSQLAGSAIDGEVLPTTNRDLNFRLTVRDCKSGQATDDIKLTVVTGLGGAFEVTSQNTPSSFLGTSTQTVTWNVANTVTSAVNCANVDIDLLTFSDDEATYGVTNLATAVTNDGSQDVTIGDGDNSASKARIRVSCSDNVFYDISDADLEITGAIALPTTGNTTALSSAAICGDSNAVGEPSGTGGGGLSGGRSGGGGSSHPLGLLVLLLLIVARRQAVAGSLSIRAYIQS